MRYGAGKANSYVWATHLEPIMGDPFLQLLERQGLMSAATRHQVPAILCGHTHRSGIHRAPGGNVLVCGTTCERHPEDGHRLQVVEAEVIPGGAPPVRLVVRQYRLGATGFAEYNRQTIL